MLATMLFAGVNVEVERYVLPCCRSDRAILAFKLNVSLSRFVRRPALMCGMRNPVATTLT
jgi:hypothetical protein